MASSGNFSTMNPLNRTSGSVVYTNGNLSFSPGSSWSSTTFTRNNMYIPKDKKIYFELYHKTQNGYYAGYGFGAENAPVTSSEFGATGCITTYYGNTRVNGTQTSSQFTSPSEGDIIQFAIDGSNNKVWFGINNTWVLSGDPANGSNEIGTITTNSTVGYDIGFIAQQNAVSTLTMNFGQDSTFAGDVTAGGNADANGFGDFKYAPPTGFLALCSGNLSVSDDIDPAQTDDDYPSKQFNAITYTGNGGTNAITGLGFKPDLVWVKRRNSSGDQRLVDSSRGVGVALRSNVNGADVSEANGVTAFGTDGFTLGSEGGYNANSDTFIGWCWRANGGTTTTDTSGDISTVRQSNTASGFAILTWSGNGSNNQRLPHGLGKKPALVIAKRRDAAQSWGVWTQYLGANSKELQLESTSAQQNSSNAWYQSGMTTDFVGMGSDRNHSSSTNVAYVWADVEGMQKFGTYEGNGNNNGAFIYTGFRPRLVFIKNIDASQHWVTHDSARETFNPMDTPIDWDDSYAEYTSSARAIDFLSNGFKCRTSDGEINSSQTFIYGAWADVPFKYNNTF